MNSREYWAKREAEQRKRNIKEEEEYNKRLQEIYEDMCDDVQKEIDSFFRKYAKKEGLTLAEAKKRVSEMDIKEYERKAKKYVKEKDFSPQANEEMRLYNLTMKVNRLEMLKANIGLELIKGHEEMRVFMEGILKGRTLAELERQAGILGKTVRNNAKTANAIVNASFHNAKFSDRIWVYQDALKSELSSLLQKGLIAGKNPRELARELRKRFDVTEADAERLMITELARVQIEAQRLSMIENGFTQYMFIPLGSCCDICREVERENGGIYDIEDMMPGENAPPMHPRCRCAIAPYEDDEEYEAWLDFLDKGGTTEEWNKKQRRKPLKLNLQFFAKDNKKSILRKIEEGIISKEEFERCYNYYQKKFENGVTTPMGEVHDKKDRFYHIVDRHEYMMCEENIDRIVTALEKPDKIYKTKDKFGNEAYCYIEKNDNDPLLVIERNGIITAYEPSESYLKNNIMKKGELIWESH